MSTDIELEFVPCYVVTRQILPPAENSTKYMVPPCGIQTAVPQHLDQGRELLVKHSDVTFSMWKVKKKEKRLDPQKEMLLTCWDVSSWKWLTGRCGSKGRMELRNNGGHEGTSPASLDCNSRFTKACFCGDFISELWSLIAISLERLNKSWNHDHMENWVMRTLL